jgi:hypothetical protein
MRIPVKTVTSHYTTLMVASCGRRARRLPACIMWWQVWAALPPVVVPDDEVVALALVDVVRSVALRAEVHDAPAGHVAVARAEVRRSYESQT